MPRKKPPRTSTKAQRNAGRTNIIAFNAERASRQALKSGISSTEAQSGKAPAELPDAAAINAEVDALVAQIVADQGGESEITANRKTIIAAQRTVLTVLALAQRYIVREGLINRKGKPHPLLGLLVSYANCARLNSVALGLARVPRKIGPSTLAEYLDSHTAAPAQDEAPR
jgi:hypothetical protein